MGELWAKIKKERKTQRSMKGFLVFLFLLAIAFLLPSPTALARRTTTTRPSRVWMSSTIDRCARWCWCLVMGFFAFYLRLSFLVHLRLRGLCFSLFIARLALESERADRLYSMPPTPSRCAWETRKHFNDFFKTKPREKILFYPTEPNSFSTRARGIARKEIG